MDWWSFCLDVSTMTSLTMKWEDSGKHAAYTEASFMYINTLYVRKPQLPLSRDLIPFKNLGYEYVILFSVWISA